MQDDDDEITMVCATPGHWKFQDTDESADSLVQALNHFSRFQPKIANQQAVKIRVIEP